MIVKNQNQSNLPKKLIVVAVILVVLVSTFLVLEATGVTHFISSFNGKASDQIKTDQTNSDNKQDFIKGQTNNTNTGTTKEPTAADISITTRSETNGSVTVLTQLQNYSDGICDLTITNNGATYKQTAAVLFQPSYSTCEGFNIPVNTVANGTWQITLDVTSKGKVNTKTISVEIQ